MEDGGVGVVMDQEKKPILSLGIHGPPGTTRPREIYYRVE